MSELIWVGNTLHPRWFVMVVPVVVLSLPFLIVGVVRLCKWAMGLGH